MSLSDGALSASKSGSFMAPSANEPTVTSSSKSAVMSVPAFGVIHAKFVPVLS